METVAENKTVVRSSEVVGVAVVNNNNESLGKIYDVVLDKVSGQVTYIVLESGAILGLGGKLFALPWNSIRYNAANESFVANINKENLKNSSGFDKNNWPTFSDKNWAAQNKKYFTTQAF